MAKKVLKEAGYQNDISGFTLFWNGTHVDGKGNKVEPGYQMSVRVKGGDGWSVRRITDKEAELIFRHLAYIPANVEGPWALTNDVKADIRDSFIMPQSAVENWPKVERVEREYFDEEPAQGDFMSLLAAVGEAVEARTALTATLVAGEG